MTTQDVHVLVVDDSAAMRGMILSSLRRLPHATFYEAGNGLEAIEKLALAPINLMLFDLNMPEMHGLGRSSQFAAPHLRTFSSARRASSSARIRVSISS